MLDANQNAQRSTSSKEGLQWGLVITIVIVCLIVGYGIGMYRYGTDGRTEKTDIATDTAVLAQVALRPERTHDADGESLAQVETTSLAPARTETSYVGETEDPGLIVPSTPDYPTIVVPDEPPASIQVRPADPQLIEWLYGQQLLVNRSLFGDRIWTIEPGEITEFAVIGDWEDPAQVSWGVRVQFVAQAKGAGIRASGLLRYYGDGTEGNGYMMRDFLPDQVERVGRW